ncbi:ParB/RepB/Spo0J family partition protein [Mumia sp. zg.B17]|uniref:ParB/RepB/Spo0J family partition protein n=1 Tax=Mumia sp. zg.B17 TaxID=2855446 RepID=UPI001C6E2795|nr:ParB/RepB/Spo0J family partition protein [Mumia sp. zg.B17]MBW9208017.1 ParB/RepB/Spo0J family partition protein [Mumia sp. zg.B17]
MAHTPTPRAVDPRTLLVDLNVRTDLRLDANFVASIKTYGVLQPIVAAETDQGLRVRYGHRRTAAAVEAALDTVPVVVIPLTAGDGDAAEIERILTQHAENHHRAGLTVADEAKTAKQLAAFGLSAAQIAKKTHTRREHVEVVLQVGKSDLAAAAADRYDLTLDQAAALAEFDGDVETVKALVAAAKTGQFAHVAQQARDERRRAEQQAPVLARLTEEGVILLEQRPAYNSIARALGDLRTPDGATITVEDHAACPGHAAYLREITTYIDPDGTPIPTDRWGRPDFGDDVDEDDAEARWEAAIAVETWEPVYACSGYAEHGHITEQQWWSRPQGNNKPRADEMSPEAREEARLARRLVIDNNKAWKSARAVRRRWVTTYLMRKAVPEGAGTFIAYALAKDADLLTDSSTNDIAAEWFGVEKAASYGRSAALVATVENVNDKRAHVLALGQVLAGYEARSSDSAWREDGDHSPTGRYLRFLATLGYTLSEVEEYAASNQTA